MMLCVGEKTLAEKVVLAYSGGLDTSVIAHKLAHRDGYDVIAVLADVGQGEDLERARERAEAAGVASLVVVDLKDSFVGEFVTKAIWANALYEGRYPLVSALSRPCIARALVEVARAEGARKIAHGCTGKGNDQVRFEVSVSALYPDAEILAPARAEPQGRAQAVEYARLHGIPVEATPESPYSIDSNLWGRTIECGPLEDPWAPPPEEAFALTRNSKDATSLDPLEVVVEFDRGRPVSARMQRDRGAAPISPTGSGNFLEVGASSVEGMAAVVGWLNEIGGAFGFGRVDMIENRRVGIKSREVYEVPAALALIEAHRDLESLVLERDLAHLKASLEQRWADLVYDGMWYSPSRQALDAFFEETQKEVCGEVKLRFSAGSCAVVGRRSPNALYDEALATYSQEDAFEHKDAEGFVKLYGLPIRVWAARQARGEKSKP